MRDPSRIIAFLLLGAAALIDRVQTAADGGRDYDSAFIPDS